MTTACAATPSTSARASMPSVTDSVEIRTDELVVGRRLRFPIYDADGQLLLLAEDSVITTRFLELLRSRDLTSVRIHQDDIARLTLSHQSVAARTPRVVLDSELTRRLDHLVDSGSLFVANSGAPLKRRVIQHGTSPCDQAKRDALQTRRNTATESIGAMIRDAWHGGQIESGHLAAVVGEFLSQLVTDCDQSLDVVREAGRDSALAEHCLWTSILGMALGVEMGLDERNVRDVGLCGLMHDWGMVRIPRDIRDAPRPLTHTEFLEVQKHPIFSLEMFEQVGSIPSVVPLVCYQVHERLDGSGYPRGRSGKSIHLFARILAVADAYLALTAPRPWRNPLMAYAAMECLLRQARDEIYDAAIVRRLLHILSLFPIGSFVMLGDGRVARVLRRNGDQYMAPIVQVVQEADGTEYDPPDEGPLIDLATDEAAILRALPTPGRREITLSPAVLDPRGARPA